MEQRKMIKDNAFLLPISIGRECDILVQNNDHLRQCQSKAFDTWIRVWHTDYVHWNDGDTRHSILSKENKNVCCYRWALIDCLTESVRGQCQFSTNFDLRQYISKRDKVVLYYETFNCREYQFGSLKCHLSTWWVVFIVFSVILLLIFLGFLAMFNFRVHTRSKRLPVTDL